MNEYEIGKPINHVYIINYKYITKQTTQKNDIFNLVMEFIEGKDMASYLNDVNPPKLS